MQNKMIFVVFLLLFNPFANADGPIAPTGSDPSMANKYRQMKSMFASGNAADFFEYEGVREGHCVYQKAGLSGTSYLFADTKAGKNHPGPGFPASERKFTILIVKRPQDIFKKDLWDAYKPVVEEGHLSTCIAKLYDRNFMRLELTRNGRFFLLRLVKEYQSERILLQVKGRSKEYYARKGEVMGYCRFDIMDKISEVSTRDFESEEAPLGTISSSSVQL